MARGFVSVIDQRGGGDVALSLGEGGGARTQKHARWSKEKVS